MARPIFISLIPNFLPRHVKLAVKLLFDFKNYSNMDWSHELEEKLKKYLSVPDIALTESGRVAEFLLLKALGIGHGDEVIIQAFTCVAVPNAIKWVGAIPVYGDIDDTLNLDPNGFESRISNRTKAVIVQHTFGYPADLLRISAVCKRRNILLIEDCAHALGGAYSGKKLGTVGDAAFFSFGRDKVISGVWGGAVVAKDPQVMVRIKKELSALPSRKKGWIAKQLLYVPLMDLVVRTYSFLGLGKLLHSIFQACGLLSKVLTSEEKRGEPSGQIYQGMPGAFAKLASIEFDDLDSFIAHRRSIAKYYADAFHMRYVEEHTYLRFSIMSVFASEMRHAAKKRNIFLGDWYNVVVAPDTVDQKTTGYVLGSCLKAEQAASHIVNLPTHPRLPLTDASRIGYFVKNFIQAFTLRK